MKKRLLVALAGAVLLSGCQSSSRTDAALVKSPEWVEIGSNHDGDLTYVDINSISDGGKTKTAWSKMVYRKCSKKEKFCELITKDEYDCINQSSRFLSGSAFKKGVPVDSENYVGKWKKIMPGSLGASEFNFVCFGKVN